ncbi:MAG: hypothetical protein ACD_61C00007G0016 [uncultured bacterium]|nr:MAG: hypothetical protein ACD_61C00007G0016 [uncultured bacterium]
MKLSEFKRSIGLRWSILKTNIWFSFQNDIAYAGNNWAFLASTSFFTISMLIFLNILYSNIKEVAGYSRPEILLLFLMSQVNYYLIWAFSLRNWQNLIGDVNKGNLDMVLTKPLPSLFYLNTRNIGLLPLLREALPPTLMIILSINWVELNINLVNLLIGGVIMVLGLWVLNIFTLLATLPVFWLGESDGVLDLSLQLSSGNGVLIPLEGYNKGVQILFSTAIPILLTTAFSTSAILNKTNPLLLLVSVIIIAGVATIIRDKMWKLAIKNYTSASS